MTIVFDLDGTLLDGDSTTIWMVGEMLKSPLKSIAGILLAPLVLSLVLIPALRRFNGASIMLWAATAGWSQDRLRESFDGFARSVERVTVKISWRKEGLDQLRTYKKCGKTVVIATAAPEWLALSLFKAIDCDSCVQKSIALYPAANAVPCFNYFDSLTLLLKTRCSRKSGETRPDDDTIQ